MVREPLKLNKSGAPNRRSLSKFTTGLTLPDAPPRAPMELDLSDAEHLDYFAFLFSLGQALEMIDVDDADAEVTVSVDGAEVGTATADANGDWSLELTDALAEGEHTVSVSVSECMCV